MASTLLEDGMTVRDLVTHYPQAVGVLERFGIDYCCGGGQDLRQAADRANVNMETLASALNDAIMSRDAVGLDRDWTLATAAELAGYIQQRHHAFLRRELPRIEELFEKVILAHGAHHGGLLRAVQRQFEMLRSEIMLHLAKEEEVLFPLVRQLESFSQGLGERPTCGCGTVQNPIRQMEHEHENAGAALARMRELTENYALPPDACPSFATLYGLLQALEADLHEHIHLENNILFPKAVLIEQQVRPH